MRDDQGASETEQLLQIDGLAVGVAFHPDYVHNGYIYIGLNGPNEQGKKATQVCATRWTASRHTGSTRRRST